VSSSAENVPGLDRVAIITVVWKDCPEDDAYWVASLVLRL